jgi:16S rRNA processing protein RimM
VDDFGGSQSDHTWVIVGCVCKPHGVHGEVLVDVLTDFPERLVDGIRFGIGPEDGPEEHFEVHRVRYHKRRWLLAVRGLRDRDLVEGWRGRYLFLPALGPDEVPEGYYYEHQLVGLHCRSTGGEPLGRIVALEPGEAQARLVVRREGRDFLVPYVQEIVRSVDPEAGVVVLDPPRGLLDDDALTAD